jgi:hypothetical protein
VSELYKCSYLAHACNAWALCVFNNRETPGVSSRIIAYDLVNGIPEELLIRFRCNLATMVLGVSFFAEKLLVGLDLLSR